MKQIILLILRNIRVHVQYSHDLYYVVCDVLQNYRIGSFREN